MPTTLEELLISESQADILAAALEIATMIGLPVTSWQAGDPTRSMYLIESKVLGETLEPLITGYIQSGFLDFADDEWRPIVAKEQFNVDVPDATFAETDVTLTNTGGGVFVLGPGDVRVENSTSQNTYHSTTGGTLSGVGATLSVHVISDVAGPAGNALSGQIDTVITDLLGVTVTNPLGCVGLTQPDKATVVAQCRNKASSFSPNGPQSAYDFVAVNTGFTGVTSVTKSKTSPDSDTGEVIVTVASSSGPVSNADVAAVQAAIQKTVMPLTITPFVQSAVALPLNVAYTIWVYASINQSTTQVAAAVLSALQAAVPARPIGGDVIPPATTGKLYVSFLEDVIGSVAPKDLIRVQVTFPTSDLPMAVNQDLVLGTVTPNVVIVPGSPS